MAEGLKLEKILTEEQLSVLTDSIKNSLENHIRLERENIEKLTTENAHIKATAERSEFRLGKELLEAESKYKQLTASSQKLEKQVNELEQKLSETESELKQAISSNNARLTELQILKKKNEQLLSEKEDLAAQLEKRRNEVDKLNGEIKGLTENLTSANEAKYETLAKIEEIQLHELNLEHKVKRLEQEKQLFTDQVASLSEENVQKGQEILSLKREKSTFSLELQSELEQVQEELQTANNRINDLKKSLESRDERIEKLAQQLKDAKQAQIQQEEQYQVELQAQNKLLELYKKSSAEAQTRVSELMSAVEEMHKLMNEANEINAQNEQKLNSCNMEWTKQLEEKEKEITKLQKELKDANELLTKTKGFSEEGLEKLFPTAAATSKVLHSGMTLTQIYSEYVRCQEDLQKEKTENQRLTQHLQQIVAEIEEKTPLVNQRFSEYQKALETISCLRNQLANSLTDQEVLQSERNDAKRISTQLQNENRRLKQQIADVSQQVCVLLKEVEEARGGHVSSQISSQEELVSSSDETTAHKIISKHLVTFKDITDLQEKNQQLLAIIRDLSSSQEEKEMKATEEKTSELRQKWEKTKSELQELQQERSRQAEMLENIVRQRDMYRVLLSQYQGHSPIFTSSLSPKQLTSTPMISKKDEFGLQEAKSALSQLQKEFEVYRKEKIENLQMLNEQLDKLREEASELRVQNTKLSSQLEYADERFNLLQSNSEMFKREAIALREKNQKHTATITQHQLIINNLRQEVMSTQEKLAKTEVVAENLRAERELLKNVETRLLQEKESLMREQKQQNRLVANLQAVQNNLERLESDTHNHLKNQIERLEKECESLKSKLEAEKAQYRSSVQIWEKQVQELQQKVDKEVERNHKTHDELVEAYAHIHELKQEATANAAKLAAAESQLTKLPSPSSGKPRGVLMEIKTLKDQLADAHNENKTLQEKINLAQKNVIRYRTLASDLEGQLKEQTQLSTHLKDAMEKEVKEKGEMQEKFDKQSENYEKQCRQLIDENVLLMEESTKKVEKHNQELNSLQEKIHLLEEQAKTAVHNEQKAREDCKQQAKLLEEAQEKYERELLLHSQDVQRLTHEKQKIEAFQLQIKTAEEKCRSLEQGLKEKEQSWEQRESIIKSELDSIRQKCEDLSNNNNSLLNQIELLSSQMAAVQSKEWDAPVKSAEGESKSTQQLLEVIRYLRREKDIASAENEALRSETTRLKMQVEYLEKQTNELQRALAEEQVHAQTIASTEAKHTELLKKVEMLNVLRESNQTLRNEKEMLSKAFADLENKLQMLEKQMNPTKELNVELSSQVDALSAENLALRGEVKRWQARTNQLLEQTHKMGPEDYKRLSKENENLCKQVSALNEELHKKQAELSLVNSSVTSARKDVETIKAEVAKEKSRTEALQKQLEEANAESSEKHKTVLQVKRIARKYKAQYDELVAKYDALVAKQNAAEAAAANSQETALSQQLRQDMEEKAKQYEEKTKLMTDEMEKMKETMGRVTKDAENIKSESMHKEERTKKLMLQAKQRFNQLSTQKDMLAKEKDILLKELEELKSKVALMEQAAEEDSQRTNSLKSHYESKLTMLEKEVNLSKENSEKMEKQIEELTQKISQQRQNAKPSTSAGPVDRLSLATEPLTANIKPLAPPVQSSSASLTMRHPPHSHTVTAVARTTPTASIRPIAIGTVSTSSTITSQTRTATVLPTTAATTSSATPISDEEIRSIASPTSSQLSPALPQATVQPTPTIPTATVTSVVVIGETPSAAVAPSSHTITSHEPTSTVICMSESEETIPAQELPPVSTITSSVAPVTALVSPRVEVTDTSDQVEPSDTTSSPSVIVSPSGFSSGANITQTQVVVPTVKRHREEDPSEHSASMSQGKRIRMKSEGSQTTQQLPTEIPDSTPSSVNVAVVVSQPISAESTVIEKAEVPLVTDFPSEQEKNQDQGSCSSKKLASIQTENEEPLASTSSSSNIKQQVDEEEVIIVESDDEKQKEESYDEQEDAEDFHEGEEMDDDEEEGDEEPQTDEYEDDNQMQEENYPQDDDVDDDVMSAGPFEVETDMSQQASDEVEIVVLDDGEDNQMDAQETTQVQSISASNLSSNEIVPSVVNVGMPIPTESLAVPSIPPRTTLLPRIPARSERLPSMVRQQQLSFTIGAQSSGYEEGGDSIVPSTPTLFVPHRVDGFAEAVSSPHVPYDRFVFNSAADNTSSQQPLSQLATQGSLGVDDTRMDLSQFDDGSGRSVPTTPLQVSPPDITVTETPDSGSMDQQPVAISPSASSEPPTQSAVPMITITQESTDISKQDQVDLSVEPDSSVIQTADDGTEAEADKKLVKAEHSEPRFSSQHTESPGPIIVEVTGASGEETCSENIVTGAAAEPSTFDVEQISGETEKGDASTSSNQSTQSRKPIIWEDPSGVDSAPRSSSPQQFSIPTSYPALRSQQQQQQPLAPSPSSPVRASTRGRRIRLRGASAFSASRGPGNWGGRRGRGSSGRGTHMF